MRRLKPAFAALCILIAASLALASHWPTNGPVASAAVSNSGGEYLQVIPGGNVANPAGCSTADSFIVRDPAIIEAAVATAVAAYAGGTRLRVYVISGACDGPTGRPLATALGVI